MPWRLFLFTLLFVVCVALALDEQAGRWLRLWSALGASYCVLAWAACVGALSASEEVPKQE